jgi:hypothetical protein
VVIPRKPDLLPLPTEGLLARRSSLVTCIGDLDHVLLGSVVEQTRRCGKEKCRCATEMPHGPYVYLSLRPNGSGMHYVPRVMAESVRAFLQHGEHAEAVLAEISAINLELLARRHLG